ncbi:MAG: LysM peptidoglycan-binding domain-containing protein [Phycisphaerales bacterium]
MAKGTRIALVLLVMLVIGTGIYWIVVAPKGGAPGTSGGAVNQPGPTSAAGAPTNKSGSTAGAPKDKLAGNSKPSSGSPADSGAGVPRPVGSTPGSGAGGGSRNGGEPAVVSSAVPSASGAHATDGAAGLGAGSGTAPRLPSWAPDAGGKGDEIRIPPGFIRVPHSGPAPSVERPPAGFVPVETAHVPASPSPNPTTSGGTPSPGNPAGTSAPASAPRPSTAPPLAAAPAVAARTSEYSVEEGDTFIAIAEKWFGDGTKWDLILAANPQVTDPSKLRIGQKLRLPPKDARREAPAGPVANDVETTHVVQSGETLYALARSLYGDGESWRTIYDANKGVIGNDPTALKVGMKLRIPPPARR